MVLPTVSKLVSVISVAVLMLVGGGVVSRIVVSVACVIAELV